MPRSLDRVAAGEGSQRYLGRRNGGMFAQGHFVLYSCNVLLQNGENTVKFIPIIQRAVFRILLLATR